MLVHVLAFARSVGGDLVYADLLVPAADGEDVGAGGEGEAGDGVVGGVGQGDVVLQVADGVTRRGRGRLISEETRHLD